MKDGAVKIQEMGATNLERQGFLLGTMNTKCFLNKENKQNTDDVLRIGKSLRKDYCTACGFRGEGGSAFSVFMLCPSETTTSTTPESRKSNVPPAFRHVNNLTTHQPKRPHPSPISNPTSLAFMPT